MPTRYKKMRDKFSGKAKVDSPAYNKAQSKAAALENWMRNKEGKPPMQTKRKPSPR